MTISDAKKRELEVRGTTGSLLIATTALSVALLLEQYSASGLIQENKSIRLPGTDVTATRPYSLEITELDVFKQINRIYDQLLKNQVELDSDSKRALYSNLWDLYST